MSLNAIDWIVIIGYLLINLLIGVYYRRRASGNTEDFFLSGREVSWWLAGTSMVATTFAADTPLLVSGLVATQGIAGNWIWWSMCLSGMLTVFFFARYWRRAEVLTDVELAEVRYSGKPAAFLVDGGDDGRRVVVRRPVLDGVHDAGVRDRSQGRRMHYDVEHRAGGAQPHRFIYLRIHLDSLHRYIHVSRRIVGRPGNRPVSVHLKNGDGSGSGMDRCLQNRRHGSAEVAACSCKPGNSCNRS